MSGIAQNHTRDVKTTIINDETKMDRKSKSIAEKSFDLSTNFQKIINDDHNEIPTLLPTSEDDNPKLIEEKHDNCADECICKIKEAVGLIVEEIKKVDASISDLAAKSKCPYTPKPEDKKEFAKSVEKNSTVCHVIIDEMKKQRKEINEMLEFYEESSREFLTLEDTLQRQREKIEHIETTIDSITNTVQYVKADINKRHDSFLLEVESRRKREETREEILKVFLNWIRSLEAKRSDDHKAADSTVKKATEERNRDRALLTRTIGQLEEIKRIEILLMTQQATTTQGAPQATMQAPLSGCACPINVSAIIPGQSDNSRANCISNVNPGPYFNINSSQCPGGADRFKPANVDRNHVPIIYDRRVPAGGQKPLTNCLEHQRK